MINSKTYQSISLIMALVILMSSTGLSIDLHYCQTNLKSYNFFGKAKSCHSQQAIHYSHSKQIHKACHKTNDTKNTHKNCCENKKITVPSVDNLQKVSTVEFLDQQQHYVLAFRNYYYIDEYLEPCNQIVPYLNYIPPLLDKDIPVFVQSFLI